MECSDRENGLSACVPEFSRGTHMRYVVGIAGLAGGGKTSLVRGLLRQIEDAAAIHIGSYKG